MDRRFVLLACALFVFPALAGCADKSGDVTPSSQPVTQNSAGRGVTSDPANTEFVPPPPKTTNQRWHFHDYWKGSPTIVLFDGGLNLTPGTGADGLPALSALLSLPNTVIVPAETGFLQVNVSWDKSFGGAMNVTYKPADANSFFGAGNVGQGTPATILTTESMCDVPHRQESLWKFNFTAMADGTPPSFPSTEIHVNITATIGRPLFIDPPHFDWWLGTDIIPLIEDGKGDIVTAITPAGNLSVLGASSAPSSSAGPTNVVVRVDETRIVPEGVLSIVAIVNWTSEVPGAKLALRYKEGNLPSEGALIITKDSATSRLYTLEVQPPQTDTTYSNRTTWEFHVLPDGAGPAFQGKFTIVAWATRLSAAEAVKVLTGDG